MNKILLSFVTGVSLCGASAFAMDDPSQTSKHPPVKEKVVDLSSHPQKHSPLCVFAQKDLVRKTPTCPSVEMELEPFNFSTLAPDLQAHTLFYIFAQQDLSCMTSTCKALQAAGKNLYEKIWSKNRLLSVMSKGLPTTWKSPTDELHEVFSEKNWALFSENKNYLIWGKLLKEILEEAAQHYKSFGRYEFDFENPDYADHDSSCPFGDTDSSEEGVRLFTICNLQNLNKGRYQKIRNYELLKAVAKPSEQTNRLCEWYIQGRYPSGKEFSLTPQKTF